MSRRRKIVVFAALWIALFAATAGIALARASMLDERVPIGKPDIYTTARAQVESDELQATLDAIPSKTTATPLAQLEDSFPEFVVDLQNGIASNRGPLRLCKQAAVPEMTRTTEYLDASFYPRATGTGELVLQQVSLDRATFEVSKKTEDCLIAAFAAMPLNTTAALPDGRVQYRFCFTDHTRK